jgi:hypothetical protein
MKCVDGMPGRVMRRRAELDSRGLALQERNGQLEKRGPGSGSTPQQVAQALERAEEAQQRAAEAHRRALTTYERAAVVHERAAIAHDVLADAVSADGKDHRERAREHRRQADRAVAGAGAERG